MSIFTQPSTTTAQKSKQILKPTISPYNILAFSSEELNATEPNNLNDSVSTTVQNSSLYNHEKYADKAYWESRPICHELMSFESAKNFMKDPKFLFEEDKKQPKSRPIAAEIETSSGKLSHDLTSKANKNADQSLKHNFKFEKNRLVENFAKFKNLKLIGNVPDAQNSAFLLKNSLKSIENFVKKRRGQ